MASEKNGSSLHWADQAARRVIEEKGDKDIYVCAAGITPSGVVHIGNFREIITVDLVVRALKDLGKKVRFIYSWDDYDVFRKVPKGMPNQEVLKENLRRSIVDVPDPYGVAENYARHFESELEGDIKEMDIGVEFLYQSKKYRSCEYSEGIKIALQKKKDIIGILNKWRTSPLDDSWWPITAFCEKCGRDTVKFSDYDGEYLIKYVCECGFEKLADLKKDGEISLKWRVDWPMRWDYEQVDFEPGGKDHSTVGGSYTTAKELVNKIYDYTAPVYVKYGFISIKGRGGKISSSSGDVITLRDVLDVYEPEIVRNLFAGSRPGSDFGISFDLDVFTIYEGFGRLERIYYGSEKLDDEKETEKLKRIYELSCLGKPGLKQPIQPSFRHLCNITQICENDFEKVKPYFKDQLKDDSDEKRLEKRLICVQNWLKNYAPEQFKFKLVDKVVYSPSKKEKEIIYELKVYIRENEYDEQSLFEKFYEIINRNDYNPNEFFRLSYKILINKERGPKLAPFIMQIGKERVLNIFDQI